MSNSATRLTELCFVTGMLFHSVAAFGQTPGDAIIGTWWNQERVGKIEIYKTGNTYHGKLIWLKEPNDPATGKLLLDQKNPDEKLRNRPILGSQLLYGFTFDASAQEWSGGQIYDGREGKTYKCFLKLTPTRTLAVRGYIGAVWMGLGKTNVWTKAN